MSALTPAPSSSTPRRRVFTGTRPTGPWHIGHMWGVLANMRKLQEEYDCLYCIVDYHALTTAWATPERIQGNIREIALDWMSYGIDPLRSTLFVQSHVPEVAEFSLLLEMITPTAWLERNPTYAEVLKENSAAEANAGLLTYPVLQTADIALYKGELVPIGKDQTAHLNLSSDIVKSFQRIFKRQIFPVPEPMFAELPLIPGIDNRKMSKSYGNAIEMRESEESTLAKVMKMYTDPQKQRLGDVGRPESCPVGTYHTIVSPKATVDEVFAGCRAGTLGCVDCKKMMGANLNAHMAPIRERRRALEADRHKLDEILAFGASKAKAIARETLREVRGVMGLDRGFYLNDGGEHLPPSLQFNPQDPEFQGGYYQYYVEVPEASRLQARQYLIGRAPVDGFKFSGFETVPGGELVLLASSNGKLTIEGHQLKQYGAGYEIRIPLGVEQQESLARDKYQQFLNTVTGLSNKIYAGTTRPYIDGEFRTRVFGKSFSPSDLDFLKRKLGELLSVPPESIEIIHNDQVDAGYRHIGRPEKVEPPK